MLRRSVRCSLALLLVLPLLAAALAYAPDARADETRRSTLQVAAIHGMKHTDTGTNVLLEIEDEGVRLRVYPGTSTLLVAGRQYQVKDRFVREAGRVMVSPRVQRFIAAQVRTATAEARAARARIVKPRPTKTTLPPLEPLPPRVTRAKRKPSTMRVDHRLTRTAKRAVTGDPRWVPHTKERRWQWIVIHHSDDRSGNLAKYHDVHLNQRGWEHGCGYHFVIGNGSQSGDGEVELSKRWQQQLQGAHTKVPGNRYNEHGIGICLVGDFDEGGRRPTPAQMEQLAQLIRWLRDRYGIDVDHVHGHRDCCATQCPGRFFPWDELRARIR